MPLRWRASGGASLDAFAPRRAGPRPERSFEDEFVLEELPGLQYSLHRAAELAYGLEPPEGAEGPHVELAAALEEARDATAEVLAGVEASAPRRQPASFTNGAGRCSGSGLHACGLPVSGRRRPVAGRAAEERSPSLRR